MHSDSKLLTTITLHSEEQFIGIVDFVSNKQLYFFDFSREHNIDFLMLCMLWQGTSPQLRFSVYCTINYPNIRLPKAILVPLASIKSSNHPLSITKKPKPRKVKIRTETL